MQYKWKICLSQYLNVFYDWMSIFFLSKVKIAWKCNYKMVLNKSSKKIFKKGVLTLNKKPYKYILYNNKNKTA